MPETESAVENIPPLSSLTEEETMLRDTVRQFAQQEIAPRVREMDEAQKLDPGILRQLFELGLMAIEAPLDLGGAGASFFSAVLAVEEISRASIPPSPSSWTCRIPWRSMHCCAGAMPSSSGAGFRAWPRRPSAPMR